MKDQHQLKRINHEHLDLLIRPKLKIKSRQWWLPKFKVFKKVLKKYLPKKKFLLSNKCTFNLLITNDKEIQTLNKRYRKINKPTDVLSFYQLKKEQKSNKYLGDIVISAETARKQAKKEKIKLETELLKLFIHGYLHLLHYNHKLKTEATKMFKLQNNILKGIVEKR